MFIIDKKNKQKIQKVWAKWRNEKRNSVEEGMKYCCFKQHDVHFFLIFRALPRKIWHACLSLSIANYNKFQRERKDHYDLEKRKISSLKFNKRASTWVLGAKK